MKQTKKERFLTLFDSTPWSKTETGKQVKIITMTDLHSIGFGHIPDAEQYNNPEYGANILRKMGYQVIMNHQMTIYPKNQ